MEPSLAYQQKLRRLGLLNKSLVAKVLTAIDPTQPATEEDVGVYFLQPIHFGSSTEVSELNINRKGSPKIVPVIYKRYLPLSQRYFMNPSYDPSDDGKHTREAANINAFHAHNPCQPQLYHFDSDRRLLVLEMKDGSYDTVLSEAFRAYQATSSSRVKQEIRDQVRQDLDRILSYTHHLMQQFAENSSRGEHPLALTDPTLESFRDQHLRNLGAVYDVCNQVSLAKITKERDPLRRQRRLVSMLTTSRAMEWTRKYDFQEEGDKLMDFLQLREAIAHTDLRPQNILFCDHDSKRHFSVCDLSGLRRGPSDLDLVSLLMDSRLTGMFSLEELGAIHAFHYSRLQTMYGGQLTTKYTPKDRFSLAAVHILMRDIGAVITHLTQTNPNESIDSPESFEEWEIDKMVPLENISEYFARQYLSLFRVLRSTPLFPHLTSGISTFVPERQRQILEERLHIDSPNRFWRGVSTLFRAGNRWFSSHNGHGLSIAL